MNPITIFALIIIIVVVGFLFDSFLNFLNMHYMSDSLPEELRDIYNEKEYKRSQLYKRENNRLGLISSTLSFLLISGMLLFNGFAWLDILLRNFTEHHIWLTIIYFGVLGLIASIINLPFQIYSIFVIEEKYGFNKTTFSTFVSDKVKSFFLSVFIGGGLMILIIYIYLLNPIMFWLYVWMLITAFSIFMAFLYSTLIVPLFNKQIPLEEGKLRQGIRQFAKKINFQLKNIFVIDGSKRTTKSNAYFTGFGKKKRIVLYDNLMDDLENEEIISVLAHEVGHYKCKHFLQGMSVSIFETGIMLYLFSKIVGSAVVAQSIGVMQPSFHIGLIVFGILYSPISHFLGILRNIWLRKNEYEADNFAKKYHNSVSLIEALKKISVKALSNLRPHPWYVFVNYSHPPLLQRIKNLQS